MKILLLGAGMQGQAALHDLVQSDRVDSIVVADQNIEQLEAYVNDRGYGDKVRCTALDAADNDALAHPFNDGPDVVIHLLPTEFTMPIAKIAIEHNTHMVNASFAPAELEALDSSAQAAGITILPEMGFDPGIDLILLGEAVSKFDRVTHIMTYGSGIPEPAAANNPLNYKISWTFEGVLKAYLRPAMVILDGKMIDIPADEIFRPQHSHIVELGDLGPLEAYPNGSPLPYAKLLNLAPENLIRMGRYTLRYPGHCAFWLKMAELHLLDDRAVDVGGISVNRRQYMLAALAPELQYEENERDMAILRLEVEGERDGQRKRIIFQVIDLRDLTTGLTAMSRLVGFTTSIGAQMIGNGAISQRGILSPVKHVPYQQFVDELKQRNITITEEITEIGP